MGEINNAEPDFPSWRVENTADIKPHLDPTLSQMWKEGIQKALEEYKAARDTAAGRTDRANMRIETDPTLPSSSPPYCLAHARKPIVQEKIKEMLHGGIIQPSHSQNVISQIYCNIGLSQRILASPHGSSIEREDGLFHGFWKILVPGNAIWAGGSASHLSTINE